MRYKDMNIMNRFTNQGVNRMINNGMGQVQNMGTNMMNNIDPNAVKTMGQKVVKVASKAILLAAIFAGFALDVLMGAFIALFFTTSQSAWNFYTVFIVVIGAIQLGCVIKLFKGGNGRKNRMQRPRELHIINGKEVWR